MLKELSFPQIFSTPQTKIIRTIGIKQVPLKRKVLLLGLVALNVVLIFTYILGVNNYSSTGYEIKATQNKISSLVQENRKLNLTISEKASVLNLQSELSQTGFIPVKDLKFLQLEPNQFSQK